jgi:serine/threonine protein kinase
VTQIAQPCNEPLPGYVAIECIGTGGYGEVWKVRAPGGVEKAVKTLHGYHNEELTSRELKALERIKDVRHPFILSLDRFEIHEGRLVVVMELADMSLEQCFQLHRVEQRDGIPRDELISYMRDAAEALDYMQQHHYLQHLDIKPENLLLLGKHIKVADFGLVKEVAGHTLNSMVGGMTPTYAAPEIFDNRPSPHTDQYSLAIVFQEMLTGVLPFPGRTAAQLVAQHTQGKPRVSALPEQDRSIVLKALAKNSTQRYPSCSEFIDALAGGPTFSHRVWVAPSTSKYEGVADDETQDVSSYQTEPIPSPASSPQRSVTEILPAKGAPEAGVQAPPNSLPPHHAQDQKRQVQTRRDQPKQPLKPSPGLEQKESHSDSSDFSRSDFLERKIFATTKIEKRIAPEPLTNPPMLQPTLVIGLGGIGGHVLQQLQKHLLQRSKDVPWPELMPMLALDSDLDDLKCLRKKVVDTSVGPLVNTLLLPLRMPHQYKTRTPDLLRWMSRRWLYNIPRSLKTRGYRPLGRLSLVDNTRPFLKTLNVHLHHLANSEQVKAVAKTHGLTCNVNSPRVVIVASTSGGTGSGIAVDVAHAVRKVASGCGAEDIEVVGMLVDCSREGVEANELTTANTYAFLTEYETASQKGNCSLESLSEENSVFECESPPFDYTYFTSQADSDSGHSVDDWIAQTAEYLTVDLLSTAGSLLDLCRSTPQGEPNRKPATSPLRNFSLAPLCDSLNELLHVAREQLCLQAVQCWQADLPAPNGKIRQCNHSPKYGQFLKRNSCNLAFRKKQSYWNQLLTQLDQKILDTFCAEEAGTFMFVLAEFLQERLLQTKLNLTVEGQPSLPASYQKTITAANEQFVYTLHHTREISAINPAAIANDDLHDQTVEPGQQSLSSNSEILEMASQVSQKACISYLQSQDFAEEEDPPNLWAILQQTASDSLEQLIAAGDPSNLIAQLADALPDIAKVAQGLNVSPSQCGHERHLIVVIPQKWPNDSLETAARQALPDAAIIRACITRPLILYEASNLSLAQVADRLTEYRPDAIEAARRLVTRNDIEWTPLPSVECSDAN